ncbi:30 kda heat shock [Trichoderma arundinaceum]|uniref:30 kDa heat shock n=1 Tax=Trichoderma arundinaceum TaxID=490622 RepID=A0A395NIB8_TRIAR|nr:30 kda heat shock [Trichoderma arundinaceum]
MAFFPRTFYHPTEASFTPLFRLLDDFDNYSRQSGKSCNVRRQPAPQWQPKFDVRETTQAYELHGELPGISKENVHIEFSDPQTLVIRGKTERTYTAGTSPSAHLESTTSTETIAEKEEPARRNSHQATVEDEDEASERESGFEVVTTEEEKRPEEKTPQKPVDKAKYWLTERSIGEFSRSFHFPSFVEHEGVSAGFQDGILSVTVPKAKKHEARRITVY